MQAFLAIKRASLFVSETRSDLQALESQAFKHLGEMFCCHRVEIFEDLYMHALFDVHV